MATIGRNQAVAESWFLPFTGFPAWLVWLLRPPGAAHRVPEPDHRPVRWGIDYFFYDRAVRLIAMAPPPTVRPDAETGDGGPFHSRAAQGQRVGVPPLR